MEYRVLGPLEVRDGDRSLPLAGAKQRALLALLLVNANHVVSRERLIDGLWGDDPPETAVQSVQVYVSRLRKLLPTGALLTRRPGYLLEVESDELDLRCFERLLADGHKALAEEDAERAARVLRDALELWRGPALAEFAFEPFAQAEIGRLDDLRLAAVEERIEADLALGRHADLIGELEAMISENPHRERLRGELMLALYRSGRQAEALEAYQSARRALVDELGIEPSHALQRLEKQILTQDERLETPARRPADTRYQSNLPTPATPFVARERELAEVRELLAREDVRLLTLTGPGGTGKTRLAVQAAADAAYDYEHGVWWVPLATIRDPALVIEQAAQLLGATRGLSRRIDNQRLLLLFDNFEQVIEAATEVVDLLASCPNIDLLVTSREPLHVTGEQEYAVPPLMHNQSVSFFLARARAVRPDFRTDDAVPEICLRLDNLPLALELAAARVKALSSGQILERLEQRLPLLTGGARDVPVRQRSLRATIEWSYELLTPGEQRLFGCLAVFNGGCTLEAAEQVTNADLDTLQLLVDKSLLHQKDARFWMLETIREYAAERFAESGERETFRQRHAEHFVVLAERAEPELQAAEQTEWHERLERDHGNFRSAIEWAREKERADLHQRFAASLWRFWYVRGYYREALRELESSVAQAVGTDELRAKVLNGLVVCASRIGDLDRAEMWAEESLQLSEASLDDLAIATALHALANVAHARKNVARAIELGERALDHAKKSGDPLMIAKLVGNIGNELVASDATRDRGLVLLRDALERFKAIGDRTGEAMILWALSKSELDLGEHDEGRRLLKQSLRISRELRFTHPMAGVFLRIARISSTEGNARHAVILVGAAQNVMAETGGTLDQEERERLEATLSEASQHISEAELEALLEKGRRMTRDEAFALALDS